MTKLIELNRGPIELQWELRVFGLQCHVPLYFSLNDVIKMVLGDKTINILIKQLWCT